MTDHTTTTSSPLLVDAATASAMCGVSKSTWYVLHAAGRVPSPVRLGRAVRWNRRELEDWTVAGCPARHVWEARRAKGVRP